MCMSLSKTLNPFFAMDYSVSAAADKLDGSSKLSVMPSATMCQASNPFWLAVLCFELNLQPDA
jgi:hypothetical protein